MKLRGVHHIGLTVSDMDRAISFYEKVFGGSAVFTFRLPLERVQSLLGTSRPDVEGMVTWVRLPGAALELFWFAPAKAAEPLLWNRPGCTHFALAVTGIQDWYARMLGFEVACLGAPRQHGEAWFFYITDPDGNHIELIEASAN
jgi:catechol 2,3-dioxygenase-like lactoylglutathione lyase family enzyme